MTTLESARIGRPPAWANKLTVASGVLSGWAICSLLISPDLFDEKARLALTVLAAAGMFGVLLGVMLRAVNTPENEKAT